MVWKRGGLVAEVRTPTVNRIALLHLDATQPVVLEGSAAAIWELIDGRRDQTEVVAELEATFDAVSGQMQSQVEDFLGSLAAQQLIEPVGPGQ